MTVAPILIIPVVFKAPVQNPITITRIVPVHIVIPLHEYLHSQSIKHGVNPELVDKVITCESNWKNVQSRLYNKKDGGRELSYGIAQIHITAHPEITKADALNERFAIRYITSEIAAGRGKQWTCYKKILGS